MVRWIGLWVFLTAAISLAQAPQQPPGRVSASPARAETQAGLTGPEDRQPDPANLRDAAIKILLKAAVGPEAALRANALEGLKDRLSLSQPMCRRALGDPEPVVRFAAVVISGTHAPGHPEFRKLTDRIYPLLKDKNLSVRAAALYALHRMGEPVNISPLALMIDRGDSKLRGNVALLLGLMGDRSAVPMLRRAAHVRHSKESGLESALARIQIAEAAVKLGDDRALDSLRAGMWSQYGEVRLLAISAVGAVNDRQMSAHLRNLVQDPQIKVDPNSSPDLKAAAQRQSKLLGLIAAASLAKMRSDLGLKRALQGAVDPDPMVRKEAASCLGWIQTDRSLAALAKLLEDPVVAVRVQAAASMVRQTAQNRR